MIDSRNITCIKANTLDKSQKQENMMNTLCQCHYNLQTSLANAESVYQLRIYTRYRESVNCGAGFFSASCRSCSVYQDNSQSQKKTVLRVYITLMDCISGYGFLNFSLHTYY